VGREGTRGCPGAVSQSQVGEAGAERSERWDSPEGRRLNRFSGFLFLFFSLFFLYGGTPAPEICAQRTVEGDGSHLLQLTGRGPAVAATFPLFALLRYISLRDGGLFIDQNK